MFLIAARGLGPATTAAPLQILRYTVQGIRLLLTNWAGKRRVENYEIDKYDKIEQKSFTYSKSVQKCTKVKCAR